ncbi:hypothetical protein CASFOL_003527 [Castilleja foliolosa]|uniref:Protein kinase domain-containing protein n=1 Tax=Castilleja foliolosa TaxID=1961234 RepID=A0ABD3EKR2_9LAMI
MSCFSCFGGNLNKRRMSGNEAPGDGENQPASIGNIPRTIALSQIKKATKNFGRASHIGNVYSAQVFKGSFENGQTVAFKRLIPTADRGCRTGKAPLNWDTRMRIAAGVATGLSYLHNVASPPIVYRDLKPINVLLGDGFHPKISDFRVARFASAVDRSLIVTSKVCMGTPPYWAPENYALDEGYTFGSDVYSFGALLLEMIIGDIPLDPSSAGAVAHWVKIDNNLVKLVDPELKEFPEAMLKKAVNLALKCMNVNPASRPDMINVVRGMKHLSHAEEDAEWPEEFAVVAT